MALPRGVLPRLQLRVEAVAVQVADGRNSDRGFAHRLIRELLIRIPYPPSDRATHSAAERPTHNGRQWTTHNGDATG